MISLIPKRLRELEELDRSREVAHLRRKEWPKDFPVEQALWQVPQATGSVLQRLVEKKQPETILELGTSAGYSTLLMLAVAPKAHIHTVEFSPQRGALATQSFEQTKTTQQVTQYRERIAPVLDRWNIPLDFVFIDANKPEYKSIFLRLIPFLKKDAIVMVDNMLDDREKTDPLLMYVKKHHTYDFLAIDNGVLIIYL
jgi:predicted O-methyltransferase YrrM